MSDYPCALPVQSRLPTTQCKVNSVVPFYNHPMLLRMPNVFKLHAELLRGSEVLCQCFCT